jgi:prepilin-type N-terminal cleavage/methylation domain-containing protein
MKKGITLIEVLIVMTILTVLVVGSLMTINPILQVNKAKDARRKKDLTRIKVAFEEYYNDKLCYPTEAEINNLECGDNFYSYLNKWPCDPDGSQYGIFIDSENECPEYYRVYGKLQWTDDTQAINCDYGESSSNVDWREFPDEYETGCPSSVAAGGGGETGGEEEEIGPPSSGVCYVKVGDGCNHKKEGCEAPDCYCLKGGEIIEGSACVSLYEVESCTPSF